MKKTKPSFLFCFLLLVAFVPQSLSAQFANDYQPLQVRGNLPNDFTVLSAQKAEEEKNRQNKNTKASTRKKEQKFFQRSYYSIDNLLLSGNVLFNDPLSNYVNKVADELLLNDKETRKQLRFYVMRSTAVNAFATHQGVIFITTGLLARLHNEAQLAFVLAHESVHVKKKHVIREYMEADKIEKGKKSYKGIGLNETLLRKCIFSKEQEAEADAEGLQMFLKSSYSTYGLAGFYDLLKYADLPFDTLAFTPAFLENANLKFPAYFQIENIVPADTADNDDDTYSSHPSIKLRRETMQASIKNVSTEGKSISPVNEAEFLNVKETARFELCRTYLLNSEYDNALYAAYLLSKKYPDNFFLQKIIAEALTDLAVYSANSSFNDVHVSSSTARGNFQSLCYFTEKLNGNSIDFRIVSLAYVNKLFLKKPADVELKEMYENLIASLAKSGITYEYLASSADSSTSFAKSALNEFMADEQLKIDFDKYKKGKSTAANLEIDIPAPKKAKGNYYDTRTFKLGMDKITVVDPYYARINANKKERFKYMESEGGQVDLVNRLYFVSKKAKLNLNVLSTKTLKETDADKLNDISLLNDYLSNRLAQPSGFQVPYFEREKMLALAKKYGTDNFMWTGVVSLTDKNLVQYGWLVLAIMYPVSAPFVLPQMISGGNRTIYFSLIYDVKNDKIKMSVLREIEDRTSGTILNSHIYDVLTQVKAKTK